MSSPTGPWSQLGNRIAARSGIEELMDDLGAALAQGSADLCLMGGGNPAAIPAVEAIWRREMEAILADPNGRFERMLGNYDASPGSPDFLQALADLLQREYHWPVGPDNLAVCAGGQTALYTLFNLLCGEFPDGRRRQVLLPLMPEYIGYANQGHVPGMFRGKRPKVELHGPRRFKYRVDFDALDLDQDIGAICVSRPTNPTGNLITDAEIRQLDRLAQDHGVPLIIDGAYGTPFPQILFRDATPFWNDNTILSLSLSKIGLPGTRTGIVVARPKIAKAVHRAVAIMALANGNIGQAITRPLLESGEILKISTDLVQPFYRRRSEQAQAWAEELLPAQVPWRIHESEGALFLWFWFDQLPISSIELYRRLKQRGVIVVPGEHFFFGLPEAELDAWDHSRQCLRLSFGGPEDRVHEGLRRLGEELRTVYGVN